MPSKIEHKVRDGVEIKRCGVCEQYKSLSNFHCVNNTWDGLFYACKDCWKTLRTSNTRRRAVEKYNEMCRRVREDARYIKNGIKVMIGREEFVEWYGRNYIHRGHVDRIDNKGHYILGNIQMITPHEHNLKRRQDRLADLGATEPKGTRFCFSCGTLKSEADFYPRKIKPTTSNPRSLRECCKDCSKAKRKLHYAACYPA